MKRFLLISTCIFILGCKSYPKKNGFKTTTFISDIHNPYFANPNQDYIYKASIEIYGNTFGGIFIVKKIGDHQHRIAFTTEMGNKIFDFSFDKDRFNVNYILEDFNKKILINILKKDFKVLITEHLNTTEMFTLYNETIKKTSIEKKIYYYFESAEIQKIVRTNNGKEKVRFLFSEISDNIAQRIDIIHSNIKLKITLKSIH